MNTRRKVSRKVVVAAAAVAAVMVFSMTAFAANIFGVRDLVMTGTRQVELPTGGQYTETLISMQGYSDSNEYKAAAEWQAFTKSYDQDGSVLAGVGNSSNEYTEAYPEYLVYSKEMVDKLDEILAKYNLTAYTSTTVASSEENFYELAGKRNVMDPAAGADQFDCGYVRNEGSFMFEGSTILRDDATISYQFSNSVKGTFSDVYLNIGDVAAFQEWEYVTASGSSVTLALSPDKAIVAANFDKSFVLINVLNGTDALSEWGGDVITTADLERFADMIDFAAFE